jgi:DNA uptake protein ComE-like DNA-binding protein
MMRPPTSVRHRTGSVLAIVIWSIAICAAVAATVQVLSTRQSVMGVEALSRVQARWAARAGVETMIAIMEYHTENPDPTDALAMLKDLENNSAGELETGTYDIRHYLDGVEWAGPLDEHAKANINLITKAQMINIRDMTPDVADAIVDWRDADDDSGLLGAEATYYRNRGISYLPRNANLRSFAELELIAGVWPEYARGEDWNLNGRLDPNENDGDLSWPDDNADGKLDQGWSGILTGASLTAPLSPSGMPKLALRTATPEDVSARCGISGGQANSLIAYSKQPNARLENLLTTPLATLAQGRGAQPQNQQQPGRTGRSSGGQTRLAPGASADAALSMPQIGTILNECMIDEFNRPQPGRININSVSSEVLTEVFDLNPKLAASIVSRRDSRPEGITTLAELLEIPGMTPQILQPIARYLDVQSWVFTITSRGQSRSMGTEAEMIVTVNRSTLPATILEYREP